MAKSECTACGEIFKSVASFDKHRTGSYGEPIYKDDDKKKVIGQAHPSRRCMTVAEMLAAGMLKNDRGLWISSAYDPKAHNSEDEEDEQESELEHV